MLAGVAIDAAFADPRRGHPVALFGTAAAALEKRVYGDARSRGVLYVGLCVGPVALLGYAATRGGNPVVRGVLSAVATWSVLGGTTLGREGVAMAEFLEDGDLEGARGRLSHLCGRDPSRLEAPELARATVESIAENTSDAVVAPLFWGAVAGVPGLLAYRAINTLDAMVGHHNARYEHFGWAAARLDDVANFVPARITGLLTALAAPWPGARSARRRPYCAGTATATRARTRAGARRPSRGRWTSRSAAPMSTATAWSTARRWAGDPNRRSRTSAGPYGWRGRWASPPPDWPFSPCSGAPAGSYRDRIGGTGAEPSAADLSRPRCVAAEASAADLSMKCRAGMARAPIWSGAGRGCSRWPA